MAKKKSLICLETSLGRLCVRCSKKTNKTYCGDCGSYTVKVESGFSDDTKLIKKPTITQGFIDLMDN